MSKTSCFITYFSISWIMLCYIYLSTIQTIIKYLFICKWKRMKILKDDLIVRLSVICTFGITFWLTYVNKFWSGGKEKPTVNKFNAILSQDTYLDFKKKISILLKYLFRPIVRKKIKSKYFRLFVTVIILA